MVSIRKIIHGSGLRVVELTARTVAGLLLMPFLVHHLGDRDFGFWILAGAVLGYYGILDFGIISAVQFYVAAALGKKDAERANRIVATAFFTFAAIGAVLLCFTGVLAVLAHLIVKDVAQVAVFQIVILIMGVGFAVGFPARAFVGAISAQMRWDLLSKLSLSAFLIRTGVIVFAIMRGGGLISLASITVGTDFLTYIGYYVALRKIQRPFSLSPSITNVPILREIVNYSAFTFVAKIGDQLRFYIDSIVVGAFISVAAVTHYAIASRLALTFMDLMIALMGILSPWFSEMLAKNDHAGIKRIFTFGTRLSALVSAVVASLLLGYGRLFIAAWMGNDYEDAFWPLLFLTVAIFVDTAQTPSVSYLYGVSRHKFLAYLTLVEGVANAALSIVLARKYGIVGVAIGTAIPLFIAKFIVQPIYVCHHMQLRLREYYFGILGRAVTLPALSIIVPLVLFRGFAEEMSLAGLVVMLVVQALIAIAVGYFTGFGVTERAMIRTSLLHASRWRIENTGGLAPTGD